MTKEERLAKQFGTSDIYEILGPAGTNPPTQSIAMRLKELGIPAGHVGRWIKTYMPLDILEALKPYQTQLQTKHRQATFDNLFGGNPACTDIVKSKMLATNNERYGGNSPCHNKAVLDKLAESNLARYGVKNVMHSKEIREHHDAVMVEKFGGLSPLCDAIIASKFVDTCNERFGGNAPAVSQTVRNKMASTNIERYGGTAPAHSKEVVEKMHQTSISRYGGYFLSLTPSEIFSRLEQQNLEPLEPIVYNSDRHHIIKVRCKHCGREFTTRLVSNPKLVPFIGQRYACCECQTHGAKLEWFARDYIREHYYPSAHQWSNIPWLSGKEIDIYIPEKNIGFEINGFASHNAETGYRGISKPKAADFHRYKSARCLEHGVKLYHFWYDCDTPEDRDRVMMFIDSVLTRRLSVSPGDKINRDFYPDPSEAELPYTELPPEPFDSPRGICYNSGYWQF